MKVIDSILLVFSIFSIPLVMAKDLNNEAKIYTTTNKTGSYAVIPQFDSANNFSEGLAAVRIDDKWGFINKKGEVVIKPQFNVNQPTYNSEFNDGLAAIKYGQKWGFIDKKGRIVINPKFNSYNGQAPQFSEGMASFQEGWKHGYINKKGEIVIEPKFDDAYDFKNGLASVKLNGEKYFIDKTGKVKTINATINQKLISFKSGEKYGLKDKSGNVVLEPKYDFIWDDISSDGWSLIQIGNLYGYIDEKGKVAIEPQFEYDDWTIFNSNFTEGLAVVKYNELGKDVNTSISKYGYIDKSGKIVINPQFDSASSFSEGLAEVCIEGKGCGYIGKNGNIVIELKYDEANAFIDGLAVVRVGKKYGYINH